MPLPCRVCNKQHFGRWGAAGLLLVRRDETRPGNPPTQVILHLRSLATASGNTWALPGGILDRGESPREAAIREAEEEIGLPPKSAEGNNPLMVVRQEVAILDHGSWKYTYIIADVLRDFKPSITDDEGLDVRWVPIEEVHQRRLHPDFADAWPELLEIIYPPPVDPEHQAFVEHESPDIRQYDNDYTVEHNTQHITQGSGQYLLEDDDEGLIFQDAVEYIEQEEGQNDDVLHLPEHNDQHTIHQNMVHQDGVDNDNPNADGQEYQGGENESEDMAERPGPSGYCRNYWQDGYRELKTGNQARGLPVVYGPQSRICTRFDHIAFRAMYDLCLPRAFYNETFAFIREVVAMNRRQMSNWARRTLGLALNANESKNHMLQDIILDIWDGLDEDNSPWSLID
ncbi:Putative 8-oxo-dGTP diphosphatase 3 [Cytospora mali]|uniref:8-oxo-dGTP diphosphatase 3 n=1 Tax=Cytospora mali TaxID=578113 RepID=A0A194UV56_CYTMA|nr:Putative 8-oxo-dGTP diphosphatase 3 [Valsa mali var. pyri (nom. inval.)]